MKRKIVSVLLCSAILATVSIGCFFLGKNMGSIEKNINTTRTIPELSTHIERMEYALKNIEYWELAENGKDVLVYDYDGNVYKW